MKSATRPQQMNTQSPIKKLPTNITGKDYVVGDLHGCYEQLERLLDHVRFDTTYDRLISVGDLIDRGPESLRCLNLLAKHWFHAVKGNHESMMIEFFEPYLVNGYLEYLDELYDNGFLENGGDWIQSYFVPDPGGMTEEFNLGIAMAQAMPSILIVGEGSSRFNVVHAELARSDLNSIFQPVWLDSDLDLWHTNQAIDPNTQEKLYWGRKLQRKKNFPAIESGLSITFCGHTFAENPRQVLSHLCIDTGAFISERRQYVEDAAFGLTLFDVRESRWFKASTGPSKIIESAHDYGVDRH